MHQSHFVIHRKEWLLLMLVVGTLLLGAISVTAQGPKPQAPQAALGTGFTYQGQLKSSGAPVNGSCDIAFRLYDAPNNGNAIGAAMTPTVAITNGLFTTLLDFGSGAFNGDARWLDMQVGCPTGTSTFTALNPRQALTAAPYALFSAAPWVSSGSDLTYNAGNVGVGTNSPLAQLHVKATSSDTAWFESYRGPNISHIHYGTEGNWYIRSASNSGQVVLQDTGGSVGIGRTGSFVTRLIVRGLSTSFGTEALRVGDSAGNFGLVVDDARTVQIGALAGSSTTHACYLYTYSFAACTSAAEYVPTIDDGAGFAQAADLVSIASSVKNPYGDEHSPFVVTKAAKPCDDNLLGFIVNPESGADGKKLNDHYVPLAIYGYFPAKVTLENGAIKRGDPLTTSSKPGYGMKATQACKIIGYALEDTDHEGTIQVFANHGENAAPEVAALRAQVKSQAEQIATQQTQLASQQKQLDALATRLDALEQAAKTVGAPTLASR